VIERAFPVVIARNVGATADFYRALGFEQHLQMPAQGAADYVGLRRGTSDIGVVADHWPREQHAATFGAGVRTCRGASGWPTSPTPTATRSRWPRRCPGTDPTQVPCSSASMIRPASRSNAASGSNGWALPAMPANAAARCGYCPEAAAAPR
jgi:hypothetical protein